MSDTPPTDGGSGGPNENGDEAETEQEIDRSLLTRIEQRLLPTTIRRSLMVKFLVSLIAIVLVLSLVGGVNFVRAEGIVEQETERQHTSAATMYADSIDEWRISMETYTQSLSSTPTLLGADRSTAQGYLIEEQAKLPADVRSIHYVDTSNETVVTSTSRSLEEQSLGAIDAPWTEIEPGVDVDSSNAVWHSQTAYQSATLDDQVIAFASPVAGDENKLIVVVGTIEYRVENLHTVYEGQQVAIVDSEGNTVLGDEATTASIDQGLVQELGSTRGETRIRQKSSSVVGYAATSNSDWVAVTTTPVGQAFAARDAVGTSLLSIIGTGVVALLAVGVVFGRQTVAPITELREKTEEIEHGEFDVDVASAREDEIGQLYKAFDRMSTSLRWHIAELEEAKRQRVKEINSHLEAKADEYSEVMGAAADGDLTVRMDPQSENDAMTEIGEEFNEMLTRMEATIAEVNAFASDVATASEQVTSSSEEVRSASEDVSRSVQEISEDANRQTDSLVSISKEMDDLSATIEEISSNAQHVATLSERTAKTGEQGRKSAEEARNYLRQTEAGAKQAVEQIRQLESEVGQIDELIESIREIAEKTNMIALNANIEASRSGDGGDGTGFAPVAQEIKGLSEDTKDAAGKIKERLEAIRTQTERSVEEVERTSQRVQNTSKQIQYSIESLTSVAKYAKETNNGVQKISAATQQQAAGTDEVVAKIDEVERISQDTSSEAETVAAAAEEQTASLDEVTRSAERLAEQSTLLSEVLDEFDTDASTRPRRDASLDSQPQSDLDHIWQD
jgi:methyl-accepting chemotaxis protein